MARNTLVFNTKALDELIIRLDGMDGDVKKVISKSLQKAADKITQDTIQAMKDEYLPAQGKYHHDGNPTEKSIERNPKVIWQGSVAEVSVGFDYDKDGAGGLLITGTPKMKPNKQLNNIYKSKKYMNQIINDMKKDINEEIDKLWRG